MVCSAKSAFQMGQTVSQGHENAAQKAVYLDIPLMKATQFYW